MNEVTRVKVRLIFYALAALSTVACESDLLGQDSAQNKSSSDYDFGKHDIGTETHIVITLPNATQATMSFTPDHPSLSDYQIERDGCTTEVPPQGSCVLEIAFSPIAIGDRNTDLKIDRTSASGKDSTFSPLKLTLRGFGVLPDLGFSSTKMTFPAQRISTTSPPQALKLTNNGDDGLTINKILPSEGFLIDAPNLPKILKKGESILVTVRFKPAREGSASGILSVLNSSSKSPQDIYLSGSSAEYSFSELCSASPCWEVFFVLALAALYWLAMVIVRWHRVARPTRELLRAAIKSLRTELEIASGNSSASNSTGIAKVISPLLSDAENLLSEASGHWANFLFWSRGQETTGWAYVHEAEIQMTPLLLPETVTARLETVEHKLRISNDTPCVALANSINQALTSPTTSNSNDGRRAALLAEGLNANYGREDNSFADLVSWQNKTSWLVGCGLILIVALT